ncbi:MAG: PEGA domain-containing protein [Deltaproteobacteria bacterium]|nr:PEGA domain-containing protein [Deltaproteobacteria bacterium]
MRLARLVWPLALLFTMLFSLRAADADADCAATRNAKYKVKIDSVPPGAIVFTNGDKANCSLGTTPWTGNLAAGEWTIGFEAPGYEPFKKVFKVAKVRAVQEMFAPLVRLPNPPKIDIQASADPNLAGAAVFIDGQPKGVVPTTVITTPGRHLLEIKKEGFDPHSQWIDIATDQIQSISPTLKSNKPKYGSILVDADVPGAEVSIDGNKHPDVTPTLISNVIEGIHVVEVKKAPGLPWRQTVQVKAGEQVKVRGELAALMNGGTGTIRVISDTPGARAFIDGTDMGPVPVDIKDVKAGPHIIQVKAPGFKTGEKTVTVTSGGSTIEKFELNNEVSPDQGTLKVVSMVPEASVFIDGAAVGKVPYDKKVPSGDHTVVVRLVGYKDFEAKARVEPGQTVTIQAELKAVGRLRILSTPSQANVIINGIPGGKTPLDQEVEVGETVIRIELAGFQAFEQTITIEGGKTETLSRELSIAGPSEAEVIRDQRSLSSYGARTLGRGHSTVDFSAGYPYYLDGRVTVGAGNVGNFGFDANVSARTMLARTELGLGVRLMLVDQEPFSGGAFGQVYFGSKLLDDSGRNGVSLDAGIQGSLTAATHVTITGRLYLNMYSDRHCPAQAESGEPEDSGFAGSPLAICKDFKDNAAFRDGPEGAAVKKLTDWEVGTDAFDRDNGVRLMASAIAEIALKQQTSIFGILEGAPFQDERALFTNRFAHSMFKSDFNLYLRIGMTYKF